MARFRVLINKLAEKHIKEHYFSGNKASIKKLKKLLPIYRNTHILVPETLNS